MSATTTNAARILADAIAPDQGDMNVDAARAVLNWRFPEKSLRRMRLLLKRNGKGELSAAEREELDGYVRVGLLLDVVQAKARLSLGQAKSAL